MAGEGAKQPVTVTRDHLYSQVWATSMSKLALHYGISGNGLAKICDRLRIPYPPRGYWAKKAAGHKDVQYRLPEPSADTPGEVTISPTPAPAPPPQLPKGVEDKLSAARESTKDIVVPERLSSRPHPIIAGWLAERARRKQDARADPWRSGRLSDLNFTDVEHRRHRIVDTLFKTLERHGFKAKTGDRHDVYLEIEGERVDFKLREKQRQVRRPLTDSEKSYSTWRERGWMQELQPSGILTFTLETHLVDGARHEWRDGDQSLEGQLPDIISLILLAGPILKERRRLHEEAEQRRREQEMRRYKEEERRKTDRNQWRRFVEIAEHWRDLEVARQFLIALETKSAGEEFSVKDRSLAEWLSWARERADASDPLLMGAKRIFADIGEIHSWTYRD
jgi:hypothetical protein